MQISRDRWFHSVEKIMKIAQTLSTLQLTREQCDINDAFLAVPSNLSLHLLTDGVVAHTSSMQAKARLEWVLKPELKYDFKLLY